MAVSRCVYCILGLASACAARTIPRGLVQAGVDFVDPVNRPDAEILVKVLTSS